MSAYSVFFSLLFNTCSLFSQIPKQTCYVSYKSYCLSKSEVGNLCMVCGPNPAYQLFMYGPWAKMIFTFLNKKEKIRRWIIFHDTWKLYEIILSVFIKFYWNIATLIHLHIISDYLHATAAELNSHDRPYGSKKPKIFTIWLLTEVYWPLV